MCIIHKLFLKKISFYQSSQAFTITSSQASQPKLYTNFSVDTNRKFSMGLNEQSHFLRNFSQFIGKLDLDGSKVTLDHRLLVGCEIGQLLSFWLLS